MDLLEEIIWYLAKQGVIDGLNKDAFADHLPDTPEKVVALHEYSGLGPISEAEGAVRSVQVWVRASRDNPEWGKKKCSEIFKLFVGNHRVIDERDGSGRGLWGVFKPFQNPHRVKIDENGRSIYGFNMLVGTGND